MAVGGAAFKAASDLAESQNAAKIAFDKQAPTVQRWAKNLDTAFGFTQKGALDAAAGFKLVAKDADLGAKDFTALAERASDLGSVFNIETTQAAEALRSAMVGEFEPARKLGIVLNAATIEAKAMALGIGKAGQELTAGQKQAATYALIMKQTSGAQGDATKTANTSAGQIRQLKAEMGRAAEAIGKQLLPIGTQLLKFLRGLINRFRNLSPAAQKNIIRIAGLAAVIGPAVFAMGKFITATGSAIGVLQKYKVATKLAGVATKVFNFIVRKNPYVILIAATIAIVVLIVKNWSTIKRFISGVWDWIKNTAGSIWEGLKSATSAVVGFIMDKINAIRNVIQGAIDAVGNLVSSIPGAGIVKNVLGLAHGGPIGARQAAIVGERGPELFVPNVSGTVVPSERMGGINVHFHAPVFGMDDFEKQVKRAVSRSLTRASAA